MTDSNEPSYYEVALTNRQVMFSFVLLLSCLMAAFVSGVWLGRSGESSQGTAQLETVTQETAELAGLEEFKFFSDQDATDDPAPSPAETSRPQRNDQPSTLAQDLGVETRSSAADRSSQNQPRATPQPPPRQPAARSEPRQESPPAAPSSGSGFTIQVFSTKDEAQAKKVVSDLQQDGYSAYLSPVEVGSQTMYRVRIGPFPDRESARQVADRVNRQHKLDTWIPSSGT